MSVIIRLQNLPWSANALDIRTYFRGLSIPEGGVHIVGGELGDAFIAFSTDEDARQAMMLDGGKIKEIQVKLLLSSRSEMHKVIEAARQSVPLLSLAPAPTPAPAPVPVPVPQPLPIITPFSAALGNNTLSSFGIPGLGNPLEIPQPAVIEPPAPLVSPTENQLSIEEDRDDDKSERKRSKEKDKKRSRTRSRSRDRERKERKRDRRDRSRSRERRRRDRSRSRERRDRKRDRKDRSRSRDRSPSRRSKRRSPTLSQEKDSPQRDGPLLLPYNNPANMPLPIQQMLQNNSLQNSPRTDSPINRFNDPSMMDAISKMQELAKKRNPNAFQGEQNGKAGNSRQNNFRRDGRSRFDEQVNCCVAIRNAPNHTSYGDVRRFFPYMIDKHGIKMINDNMGRRTGNIFVRFCESRSKSLALSRKNNELKGAQVDVESLDDDIYEAAVDSFLPYREDNEPEDPNLVIADEPREDFTILKLTELPTFVKEHDIIKAFGDFSLLAILLSDCRITRSKIAYVQFAKPEDAKAALDRQDRIPFGRRQATVSPASLDEFEKAKNQNDRGSPVPEQPEGPRDPRQRRAVGEQPPLIAPPAPTQFYPPPFQQQQQQFQAFPAQFPQFQDRWRPRRPTPDDAPLDCTLLKGLPRDATDRTIVGFLADTGAVPARIHLMLDASGQPSGDCFCEFRSPQEARLAAAKHGAPLDGCRVTVDLVPRALVEEALEGPKRPEPPPQQFFDPMRGGFRGGFRGRGNFDPSRGAFRGGFDQQAQRGAFRPRGFDRGGARGNFDVRGRGRGGRGRGNGPGFENGGGPDNDPALEDFGVPGCVVSMENVPFRASIDEILQFFSDFELTQDDVIRRYNERGQPTGDARVAFRTPFDAQRAVKTRHMDTIHDRRITLGIL